jgi:hypothetical protein
MITDKMGKIKQLILWKFMMNYSILIKFVVFICYNVGK